MSDDTYVPWVVVDHHRRRSLLNREDELDAQLGTPFKPRPSIPQSVPNSPTTEPATVRRPFFYMNKRPCDKYNLEGACRFHDQCKYSHRDLAPDEWCVHYPGIPYTLKNNIRKRMQMEGRIVELEGQARVLSFKLDGYIRASEKQIDAIKRQGDMINELYRLIFTHSKDCVALSAAKPIA